MADCIDEIAEKLGQKRHAIEDDLNDIFEQAKAFQHDGMSPDESYAKARDQKLAEIGQRKAQAKRSEVMNVRKALDLHRTQIEQSNKIREWVKNGQAPPGLTEKEATYLSLEATLVGINSPVVENRNSVYARSMTQVHRWTRGLQNDLEHAGLLKEFASRANEDKWTDELFELNKKVGGNPGVTGDVHALEIAKIIQRWQKVSIDALNREGAWVRSYSGYITKTTHNATDIYKAGKEKWINDTIGKLDLKRTFGTEDGDAVREALGEMWGGFARGDHYDYGKEITEPLYPNVAKAASASRELHFKSGQDWREYNKQYGITTPTQTVVNALRTAGQRFGLMEKLGTKPKEELDRTINYHLARLQAEGREAEFRYLKDNVWALDNRMAQIDGRAQRPVDELHSRVLSGVMSVQRMSKLGHIALTHFASLPTKIAEANYWGIGLGERYGSLIDGFTKGMADSEKRSVLELTEVGTATELDQMMRGWDVADAPSGILGKMESTYFKLTGVSSVLENQRLGAGAMFARHIGTKEGMEWGAIGAKEQRVMQGFGIREPEWKLFQKAEWSKIGDKTHFFPSDIQKLSDADIAAYLKEKGARSEPTGAEIERTRENLALSLATAYSDRSGFAIPMPDARIRAKMFGKHFEPGTAMNSAMRLFYQFKIWPADMISRAYGREVYGRIGDGKMDRVAGLVELVVGATIFGTFSNALREAIQGQDPIAKIKHSPFASLTQGMIRSGVGTLVGDYLLGEYDRHGFSAVASLAGPTYSQIDTVLDLLHAGENTKKGMWSEQANRQRGADLVKLMKNNTPFMNLWGAELGFNTLLWHRLQEYISPGYLKRSEQRQKEQTGKEYWLTPSSVDQYITGRTSFESLFR